MKTAVSRGKPVHTAVQIPASKSLSHRALITAALASGTSRIIAAADNQDIQATLRCIKAFGASVETDGGDLLVKGTGGRILYDGLLIDCGESGSTLRFMIPLFSLCGQDVRFTGSKRLMERPQDVYRDIFASQSLRFEKEKDILHVQGPLHPGVYDIRGDISSQFISGLLFALPLLDGDSLIRIRPPFESRSYVSLTLSALQNAGVGIQEDDMRYGIRGGQSYRPFSSMVEGDASQAAFFIALAMLRKVPLDILNMNHDSRQGDMAMLEIARCFGAEIEEIPGGCRIIPRELKAVRTDLSDCPDLGPVLFALAARAEGTSVFTGCRRLRIKESDRIGAMKEELAKTGIRMQADEDTVTVEGGVPHGAELYGHNDHRIVMAMSVLAASMEEPAVIDGSEAVAKSYPDFFRDLERTGAKTE